MASKVSIEIASEFKGKKAFDDAGKAVGGLDKTIESLGKKFTALFAADKILAFGKASVQAFLDDQKSAALLNNTLKNLNMGFADSAMEEFIKRMTLASGVADDKLRPAMSKLLTTTGDYAKSQELLTQALDISRGSGVDLDTVVQDLSNAYVGNTKGLKKYNLGLTQAQLKTMSFTDIQKKFNDQFKGSNAAYLDTYAGKIEVLKNAGTEAQETIGKGLVDAFTALAGDTNIEDLAAKIQGVADSIANIIVEIGTLIGKLKTMYDGFPSWLKTLIKLLGTVNYKPITDALGALNNAGEKERNSKLQNPSVQMFMTDQNNQRLNNMKTKVTKDQIKATKAMTAEQKKQALLKKQNGLFDMQQIELVAALKGKLSDEDRTRAELQLALLQGNEDLAKKLTDQIADSIDKTGDLKKYLNSVEATNNPFKSWQDYLNAIEEQAKRVAATGANPSAAAAAAGTGAAATAGMTYTVGGTAGANGGSYGGQVQVSVNFQGADSLSNALRDSFVSASMDGSFSQINRTVGAFDR